MSWIFAVALLSRIYLLVLITRIVLDYVRMFAHSWRPRGIVLFFAEFIYTLTDPPLKFLRRSLPPLRFGGVAIDLSFLVLFFVLSTAVPMLLNLFL